MSNPILKAVFKGRGAAKGRKAPATSLNDLSGVDATKAAIREAEDVGVPLSATKATADRAAEVERKAKVIEAVEAEIAQLEKRIATTAATLRALGREPADAGIAVLFRKFSVEDRRFLAAKALDLAKSAKNTHNNMSGHVREIVAKHLPEMQALTHDEVMRLRKTVPDRRAISTLDTATRGPVHLPTALKKGDREIELGTDRLIGRTQGTPQRVEITWPSGAKDNVWVMGELDVTIAIEVKGRTNAFDGLGQLHRLKDRGMRGYTLIDGRLWLLKYDATRVKHIVVAPPGKKLEAVKAAKARGRVSNLEVIEIPAETDRQIHALTRYFQNAAEAQKAAGR